MKQNYTMYVYKDDMRYKSGLRPISTTVHTDKTEDEMHAIFDKLFHYYDASISGYRMEYFPTMVTVKNLMTGEPVQIDRDTPWCCNPASETYWSM